ncbi:amino acid transporter [Microstroma glucosiphilum]|uniref:Amino acid transporter n=1 Tax=Pseudomicrostroma glucosiphilum TaxID=1684307 RepID=A0A316UAX7_9BASI|nr:amino acid transporter [Pseudomicrostroma glucosiphilum]PWN21994.1 amino acid transporter [Pseudomicrostroma glucosiphilum]
MASDSSHPSEKDAGKRFPEEPSVQHRPVSVGGTTDDDADERLANMGYKNEFKREFASLSTFSFAMAIMGLISSVITTFNTPWVSGGGPSVIWTWFMGSIMNMTLGVAIGELVSAYPSAGGLYTVSGLVVPKRWAPMVAYGVGWANGLGQIAGICGTAYGLASMIMSWAYVISNGSYVATTGEIVGVFCAIMVIAGILNSFPTSWLARFTASYVFVNIITTIVVAILVLARTPRDEFLSGEAAFGTIVNNSGWSDSLAFLIGLQMVQFVMTDYDATAHISEEVHKAAIAAPVAIVQAVFATGLLGFFLNICLVFASGDIGVDLTVWPGELAVAQILLNRGGKVAFLVVWPFACCVAFFVVVTATQANARSFYALARDRAIPVFFAKVNKKTRITLNAVWLVVILNIVLVMLAFASYYAVAAVFALAALGMDLSYWVPILCRQIFSEHPDVQFHQNRGPFYLGNGLFGKVINWIAIFWTLFEVTILAIPTFTPVTAITMNWASVVFFGVMILSYIWYALYAHKHYRGPGGYAHEHNAHSVVVQEVLAKESH